MSVAPLLTAAVTAPSQTRLSKDKLASSVLTALLGLVLVYAAGFAESAILHNAAHDGRHSASFPCH
ncbi:CbtB domain-containing protein [Methylovulum psychrotolerans]|uniref:Cobalt transporter n=1 Tax=Methylovulum psychrotolerans TaxID=1704499 RepID=A0A1Z4BZC9_9GAMM|nr:CbtB-domain containing protein [Methylovulum psychrotolerans]ASF46613.1 cobalt transporter [Methylovulum psychrotolerans]POZ51465.1 cobalt transporter [Methylovulum psychrotolerans]